VRLVLKKVSAPQGSGQEDFKDDEIATSVEVFAGRALSEITATKETIEAELESARTELMSARVKLSQIRGMVTTGG
jgi:hypothetical protein